MKEEDEQAATKQQQVSKHLRAAAHHLFYNKNWNEYTVSSILFHIIYLTLLQEVSATTLTVVNPTLSGEYSRVNY